jgi:hypothetical protein
LVRNEKPLLEQGTQILNETHGAIKALDPSGNIARNAKNKSSAHQATPEEYYLAEKLSQVPSSPDPPPSSGLHWFEICCTDRVVDGERSEDN